MYTDQTRTNDRIIMHDVYVALSNLHNVVHEMNMRRIENGVQPFSVTQNTLSAVTRNVITEISDDLTAADRVTGDHDYQVVDIT